MILVAVALVVSIMGVLHLFKQLSAQNKRAVLAYNKGVKLFKKDRFADAKKQFEKAFKLDPYNEVIEFACQKVDFYI